MTIRTARSRSSIFGAVLALALGVPGTAAAAPVQSTVITKPSSQTVECFPLLMVRGTNDSHLESFSVISCDVSLTLSGNPADPVITLRLKDGVANWWLQTFKDGSPQRAALADAKIDAVEYGAYVLPAGKLLASDAAQGVRGPKWIWDQRNGTLTGTDLPASVEGAWYRVCDSQAKQPGPITLELSSKRIATGAVFIGEAYSTLPQGARMNVPRPCLGEWKLSDDTLAIIHPKWGIGMVKESAAEGARFTVHARARDKASSAEALVYSSARHPLAGFWRQVSETECGTTESRTPVTPITELRFRPDGTFDLTWVPKNHHYIDYSGTYEHRLESSAFSWNITGGQFKPADVETAGKARLNERGQLVISGLHPGSSKPGSKKLCELVFQQVHVGR